jgi:glycosyltransferase involved in cell wall biosynthesis
MKVVVAAGGRFHALHLAHQLEKRDALKKLFTTAYDTTDQSYVSSRFVSHNNNLYYLNRFFQKARLSKIISKSKFFVFKDNLFDFWLSKKIKNIGACDIFVGWAHFFLHSLPYIKKTGAKTIVECGSTHILEQTKLLQEEYERFGITFSPISKKNKEKILAEYEQSDYIMTCSNFTYKSFIKHGISQQKILKVSYGVDVDFFNQRSFDKLRMSGCRNIFRVICVGLMCLRKGIPYLLEAWKKLKLPEKQAELLLVGNIQPDIKQYLKNMSLPKNVRFYGSVNRKKLLDLYKSSSLFVLPSIEEGLSMTIAEGMASGLPILCTTNTGGQELVEDEIHGFVVPIRNANILAEKILWCYQNQEKAQEMGNRAQCKVQEFTWDTYGEKIFDTYKRIL